MAEPVSPDRLFELYKIALEEYRFNVRLNWDRSMYYITFNTALLSVGVGLFKVASRDLILFVAGVFLVGTFGSLLGILAIHRGHIYYRRANYKKTLLEDLLGFASPLPNYSGQDANLAIATTIGQAKRRAILDDTERYLKRRFPRPGNIVFYISLFLLLISVIDAAAAALTIGSYLHSA